ncbi:MAG: DUF4760 domain-containing protein [Xanthobacteraceae bacterium]|nr:DUF4760 domain-containing protein [Xanthobacteraceae bacterium]
MLQQSISYWMSGGLKSQPSYAEIILHYAPLIAAIIAFSAGVIALIAIGAQKEIARKRASIDFFLKADLDSTNLTAGEKFVPGAAAVEKLIAKGDSFDDIQKTKHYKSIEAYLNVHELLAVGLRNSVFDEKTCFEYWADALLAHYLLSENIITLMREQAGDESAYIQVQRLSEKWKKKKSRRAG